MTRLNTTSTIHDIALFLLFDISAHLTLSAFITYSCDLNIAIGLYTAVIFQFFYYFLTHFFVYMLYLTAYLASYGVFVK